MAELPDNRFPNPPIERNVFDRPRDAELRRAWDYNRVNQTWAVFRESLRRASYIHTKLELHVIQRPRFAYLRWRRNLHNELSHGQSATVVAGVTRIRNLSSELSEVEDEKNQLDQERNASADNEPTPEEISVGRRKEMLETMLNKARDEDNQANKALFDRNRRTTYFEGRIRTISDSISRRIDRRLGPLKQEMMRLQSDWNGRDLTLRDRQNTLMAENRQLASIDARISLVPTDPNNRDVDQTEIFNRLMADRDRALLRVNEGRAAIRRYGDQLRRIKWRLDNAKGNIYYWDNFASRFTLQGGPTMHKIKADAKNFEANRDVEIGKGNTFDKEVGHNDSLDEEPTLYHNYEILGKIFMTTPAEIRSIVTELAANIDPAGPSLTFILRNFVDTQVLTLGVDPDGAVDWNINNFREWFAMYLTNYPNNIEPAA